MMSSSPFHADSYRYLLERLKKAGYQDTTFTAETPERKGLLVRHDVDYDWVTATEMAVLEARVGIKAHYFLQVSGSIYNPCSKSVLQAAEKIKRNGHSLQLYFDANQYIDFENALRQELHLFEHIFKTKPNVVSLVKPSKYFTKEKGILPGIRHTVESHFTQNYTLFEDTGHQFKDGHPLDSEAFKVGKNIYLNIQPIWWMLQGTCAEEKLRAVLERHLSRQKSAHLQREILFKEESFLI